MHQARQCFRKTDFRQVFTRLAQTGSSQTHLTHLELFSGKLVQADSPGHDISSRLHRCEGKARGMGERLDLFTLNQRNLKLRYLSLGRKCSYPRKISVALATFAGNSADFGL